MKESQIQVGKTYVNKGAGRTVRRVKAIGPEFLPKFRLSTNQRFPDGAVGVLYSQIGPGRQIQNDTTIWLKSFAAWAGAEVEE